ncbi:unnamed protein product [Camellia sinensis]
MRLKLRHVKRSSQEETDRSFNRINLDYIFEEDDPISPWIEKRENPLLDGVDNSEWLELVLDDDGGGGNDSNGDGDNGSDGNDGGGTHRYQARCTSQSSTPTLTQSDNSGGLTPSNEGGGDGDGDGEGTSHGDGGGGGGDNGGDGSDGTSFGAGSEDFIGGFGLCDVGEHYDIGEPVAPLPQLPRRFRGSDTLSKQYQYGGTNWMPVSAVLNCGLDWIFQQFKLPVFFGLFHTVQENMWINTRLSGAVLNQHPPK